MHADLPPPREAKPHFLARLWTALTGWLVKPDVRGTEDDAGTPGKVGREVTTALSGAISSSVGLNRAGETIVSVGVPIQRFRTVRGVLLLSTQGGDIDALIWNERIGLLRVFLVAAIVMTVLSFLLAGTIARAGAASRRGGGARAARHQVAPGDPGFQQSLRRDRASFRRAARHDARAL